jgi:hypothetical protein
MRWSSSATTPLAGHTHRPGYPPEYRMLAFDQWGIVVDVIGEAPPKVMVLELTWAG